MKHLGIVVTALVLQWATTSHARQQLSAHAGDIDALIRAVETANASGAPTLVHLSGTFEFAETDTLPPIVGDIQLLGSSVVFKAAADGGPHQFVRVEPGGRLDLQGMAFENFLLSHIQVHDGPFIENRGRLLINGARFENIVGRLGGGFCCTHDRDELIANYGYLELSRTSFLHVGLSTEAGGILTNRAGEARLTSVLSAELPDGSPPGLAGVVLNDAGLVRLSNVTLQSRGTAIVTSPGAHTELVNSIIADPRHPGARACEGAIVSLGSNLAWDASCGLQGPGDLQQVVTGVLPLRIERRFEARYPVLALAAASPGVDSADPGHCGDFDLLFTARPLDGDNDGIAICDRGAVELRQTRLTEGGITGLYHVPGSDGHYMSILDNPHNVLVIWNTFDRDGNAAWVFGTGRLVNGRSLIAEAYTNDNGVLTATGPVDIQLANPWGILQVEMNDCDSGRLIFESERPEFGAGSFEFRRLASSAQLGCAD